MLRKPLIQAPYMRSTTVTYKLWVARDQIDTIRAAQACSEQTWAEWISKAILHFQAEPVEEIESLLCTWVRRRGNKMPLSLRMDLETFGQVKKVVNQYPRGTMQACLHHALFIHTLRTSLMQVGCEVPINPNARHPQTSLTSAERVRFGSVQLRESGPSELN